MPDALSSAVVAFADIEAAAARLRGHVHETPVLHSTALDDLAGARVRLKAEHLQRTGSFKARGAHNKLLSLTDAERSKGVVAISSGNHATAVACAGARLGVSVDVYMPDDAPDLKLRAARGYGATVHLFDRATEDRATLVGDHTTQHGSIVIEPFDDPIVMAGQGTAAVELLSEVTIDALVVPMSGGGLMAGCATAAHELEPDCRLVGVEPETADDTKRSFAAGERVTIPPPSTIADGLALTAPGRLTFPVNHALVDEVVTVNDAEMIETMRFLFERMKQVVEPSGAAALAAVMAGRVQGRDIGVIVSGGNIGITRFASLTRRQ